MIISTPAVCHHTECSTGHHAPHDRSANAGAVIVHDRRPLIHDDDLRLLLLHHDWWRRLLHVNLLGRRLLVYWLRLGERLLRRWHHHLEGLAGFCSSGSIGRAGGPRREMQGARMHHGAITSESTGGKHVGAGHNDGRLS